MGDAQTTVPLEAIIRAHPLGSPCHSSSSFLSLNQPILKLALRFPATVQPGEATLCALTRTQGFSAWTGHVAGRVVTDTQDALCSQAREM